MRTVFGQKIWMNCNVSSVCVIMQYFLFIHSFIDFFDSMHNYCPKNSQLSFFCTKHLNFHCINSLAQCKLQRFCGYVCFDIYSYFILWFTNRDKLLNTWIKNNNWLFNNNFSLFEIIFNYNGVLPKISIFSRSAPFFISKFKISSFLFSKQWKNNKQRNKHSGFNYLYVEK